MFDNLEIPDFLKREPDGRSLKELMHDIVVHERKILSPHEAMIQAMATDPHYRAFVEKNKRKRDAALQSFLNSHKGEKYDPKSKAWFPSDWELPKRKRGRPKGSKNKKRH